MADQVWRGIESGAGRGRWQVHGIYRLDLSPQGVIVIGRDQGQIHVSVIDGMYRMKLYFEDAGKMTFAANMGMPGSIEDEIRGLILAGVNAPARVSALTP